TTNDFANFQVWLYETTHVVEFRFGPSLISNPQLIFFGDPGPFSALISNYNTVLENVTDGLALVGNAVCPTAIPITDLFDDFLTGMPPANKIYRFTPGTLSVPNVSSLNEVLLHPNPATNFIQISSTNDSVINGLVMYNYLGQKVMDVSNPEHAISVEGLEAGVYLVEINTSVDTVIKRFIKK
ncbi:MAG: T9SS type A sorting domain-containing protein, partial [Flavobacterium sp.]